MLARICGVHGLVIILKRFSIFVCLLSLITTSSKGVGRPWFLASLTELFQETDALPLNSKKPLQYCEEQRKFPRGVPLAFTRA